MEQNYILTNMEITNNIAQLNTAATRFLNENNSEIILGPEFHTLIQNGNSSNEDTQPEDHFKNLLANMNITDTEFFNQLIPQLNQVKITPTTIHVNEVLIPNDFLMAILTELIPGNQYITIKTVDQLKELTNLDFSEELQQVIDTYPVRLSLHVLRQMRFSSHVTYQYLPFLDELNPNGLKNTWVGQFHQGLLEQMYQNRPIFVLNMTCPVYCRFCFRKHKECRNQKNPTLEDVKNAITHLNKNPHIKEVVLTGGDPFTNAQVLTYAVEELKKIPHIKTLRLATRSIAYYPQLFTNNNNFWLDYLKKLYLDDKRIEIATHFIHPDEVTIESLNIISELTKNGIRVYVQTPFLKDCNDNYDSLTKLYQRLRSVGTEIHYVYIPCSPIQGNRKYSTTFAEGLDVAAKLRPQTSDRSMPHICTATTIGKIDWNTSGWAIEQADENNIWIRTPYTEEYFKQFSSEFEKPSDTRINEDGTLDVKYLGQIGDPNLFNVNCGLRIKSNYGLVEGINLEQAREKIFKNPECLTQPENTTVAGITRAHKTRVELNLNKIENELLIKYLNENCDVTDLVFYSTNNLIEQIEKIENILLNSKLPNNVNHIRLRSIQFSQHPDEYTEENIQKLARINRIDLRNPLKLEIETVFLHSSEFNKTHELISNKLRKNGITVYANVPLIMSVNATPDEILNISYKLRETGIEFHQIYIEGLPINKELNQVPIEASRIIQIASNLRRFESGREIPFYIISTDQGEVDFSLNTQPLFENKQFKGLRLLPYNTDLNDTNITWN